MCSSFDRVVSKRLLVCVLWFLVCVSCSDQAVEVPEVQERACPEGSSRVDGVCVFEGTLEVLPSAIGPATQGRAFWARFVALSGEAPYTFSAVDALPEGLALSAEGVLDGVPTQSGEVSFGVQATDAQGRVGAVRVALTILPEESGCEPSEEVCDGVDNDCDGSVDEDAADAPRWFVDADNDGFAQSEEGAVQRCTQPEGTTETLGDCDDTRPDVFPNAEEVCDQADNDCDGSIDEDLEGCVCEPSEEVCDGVDNDCDGEIDNGVLNACGACGDVPEEVCDGVDNDCDGDVDNGVLNACGACGDVPEEICDGADNDCDGEVDEDLEDCGCEPSEEVCDGVDNDCDGSVDEDAADALRWFRDADNDGRGIIADDLFACDQPDGYIAVTGDCDDTRPDVYSGAPELCDNVDNDCNGEVDEDLEGCGCEPTEEVCDGVDNDCDGEVDEDAADAPRWFRDADNDGRGVIADDLFACDQPDGYIAVTGDCDDTRPDVYSGAPELCDNADNNCNGEVDEDLVGCGCEPTEEVCDGVDNDCDGEVDEDATDAPRWFRDADNDGRGIIADDLFACDQPDGYIAVTGDCDDTRPDVYSGAPELCDNVDNNCNSEVDEEAVGTNETCGDGADVCVPGTTQCVNGGLICEGVVLRAQEICDGEDNDCDGEVDESDPDEGTYCVPSSADACGTGVYVCENDALVCDLGAVDRPTEGRVDTIPLVGGDFVHGYTGTDDPFRIGNNESYSVLITSDGDRIYNVAYGIDGAPWTGWTVRTFEVRVDELTFVSEIRIPVDWDATGAPRIGFTGVAARQGLIYAINYNTNDVVGEGVWILDLETETATRGNTWGGRVTQEATAEYDSINDTFWTMQFFDSSPTLFQYPSTGIDGDDELRNLTLYQGVPQVTDQGILAVGPEHFYTTRYRNGRNPTESEVWRTSNGTNGNTPGSGLTNFAQVRSAASMTYHPSGFIYIPDQNNLGRVRRISLGEGASVEVCDGVDNDCDGFVDEDGACAGADLSAIQFTPFVQSNNQLNAIYTVQNTTSLTGAAHVDRLTLVPTNAPGASSQVLAEFNRAAFSNFETRGYNETVALPANLPAGDYEVRLEVDVNQSVGDPNRANNTASSRITVSGVQACLPDDFEPNDQRSQAADVEPDEIYAELRLCGLEEDWFALPVEAGNNQNQAAIQILTGNANLDLYVYDSSGNEVTRSATGASFEFVTFSSPQDDVYFLQVVYNAGAQDAEYLLFTGIP